MYPGGRLEDTNKSRLFCIIGASFAGLAVAAGAFGAHALADLIAADRLQTYETAARYQMYHSLAVLLLGIWMERREARRLYAAGWCFVAGMFLFSGSLYALVLTDTRWLGAITPFGGVAFLTGWGLVVWESAAKR